MPVIVRPRHGVIAAVAIGVAWLYADTVAGLMAEWVSNPDASYGLVLAAAAIAIGFTRAAKLVRENEQPSASWMGLVCFVCGLCLYFVGGLAADVFLTRISLVVGLTGLTWFLVGGRALRALMAPIAFLALSIPLPSLLVNSITLPLQLVASRLAGAILFAVDVPVFRDGNVLYLPSTTLQVAEACSGLRSAISLSAVGILLAWIGGGPTAGRVTVVAATVPIAVALNAVRVAATGMAVERWGPAVTSGSWHTFTGWITFALASVVLIAVQRVLSRPAPQGAIAQMGEAA